VVAAVALAKLGRSVLLIEPTKHLGGMTSAGSGGSTTPAAKTWSAAWRGTWIEEMKQCMPPPGIDTKKIGNAGWVCEPHVAEQLFERWIADNKVSVIRDGAPWRACRRTAGD